MLYLNELAHFPSALVQQCGEGGVESHPEFSQLSRCVYVLVSGYLYGVVALAYVLFSLHVSLLR